MTNHEMMTLSKMHAASSIYFDNDLLWMNDFLSLFYFVDLVRDLMRMDFGLCIFYGV